MRGSAYREAGGPMSIVKRHLADREERLVDRGNIIDKGALVLDAVTDEVYFSAGRGGLQERLCHGFSGLDERARSRLRRYLAAVLGPFVADLGALVERAKAGAFDGRYVR